MHIMFTDETNVQPSSEARFFIYGGLIFPIENLLVLDSRIEEIRAKGGYLPGDQFKFDTRSRPDHVTSENATLAKCEVINLCLKLDCKFITHIILHDIIKNQDIDQQVQWALDYVLGKYNNYLRVVKDYGICVVDNLPIKTQFQYLSNKFSFGLEIQEKKQVPLDRIKLFATTCSNASHASSAMDIVLGSFRYCINNPRNIDAASKMMSNVVQMMWHRRVEEKYYVGGMGLIIRPKLDNIKIPKYRNEYDLLERHVNLLLYEAYKNSQSKP